MHALSVIVLVKGDADANGIEETLKAKSLDSVRLCSCPRCPRVAVVVVVRLTSLCLVLC